MAAIPASVVSVDVIGPGELDEDDAAGGAAVRSDVDVDEVRDSRRRRLDHLVADMPLVAIDQDVLVRQRHRLAGGVVEDDRAEGAVPEMNLGVADGDPAEQRVAQLAPLLQAGVERAPAGRLDVGGDPIHLRRDRSQPALRDLLRRQLALDEERDDQLVRHGAAAGDPQARSDGDDVWVVRPLLAHARGNSLGVVEVVGVAWVQRHGLLLTASGGCRAPPARRRSGWRPRSRSDRSG